MKSEKIDEVRIDAVFRDGTVRTEKVPGLTGKPLAFGGAQPAAADFDGIDPAAPVPSVEVHVRLEGHPEWIQAK